MISLKAHNRPTTETRISKNPPNPSKLFFSSISSKQIKSWIDMVTKDEETNHSQV
jgi:hypothetical protein